MRHENAYALITWLALTGCSAVLDTTGFTGGPDAGTDAGAEDAAVCTPAREVCDGVDNDCNDVADEGCDCSEGSMRPCAGGSDVGECAMGVQTCDSAGHWSGCQNAIGPTSEMCNGLDDDCDTVVDGPAASVACGSAARASSLACTAGACVITECHDGYYDCDSDVANGCEVALGSTDHCGACGDACGFGCEAEHCNDATRITAGSRHACALRSDRTVVCWGQNTYGQLGDGTMINRSEPSVVGGLSNAIAIAGGSFHTCALLADATVRCWGRNDSGQLGDGTLTSRPEPVAVSGLTSVIALAAGEAHTCALRSDGFARCWGLNRDGQLGDGTATDRPSPVSPQPLGGPSIQITSGALHTCALRNDGTVRCWGSNASGQLGDGSTTSRVSPVTVTSLTGVIALDAGGSHTCAVQSTGIVGCWGNGEFGQLGDGSSLTRASAAMVADLWDITAVEAGTSHTCALKDDGSAYCWGLNVSGQLGDGTTTGRPIPAHVVEVPPALGIAAGRDFTCALGLDGGVMCWGLNSSGQLGDATTTNRPTPGRVSAP